MNETPTIPVLLLTPRQTAKALNISERSLATYTKKDIFAGIVVRVGHLVRYDADGLRRWIQDHAAEFKVIPKPRKKSAKSPEWVLTTYQ